MMVSILQNWPVGTSQTIYKNLPDSSSTDDSKPLWLGRFVANSVFVQTRQIDFLALEFFLTSRSSSFHIEN
jgi:hypothetical protein